MIASAARSALASIKPSPSLRSLRDSTADLVLLRLVAPRRGIAAPLDGIAAKRTRSRVLMLPLQLVWIHTSSLAPRECLSPRKTFADSSQLPLPRASMLSFRPAKEFNMSTFPRSSHPRLLPLPRLLQHRPATLRVRPQPWMVRCTSPMETTSRTLRSTTSETATF